MPAAASWPPLHPPTVQDNYFNLGAASERWIPPERRIKQRAAVPAQVRQGCRASSKEWRNGEPGRRTACHGHGQHG